MKDLLLKKGKKNWKPQGLPKILFRSGARKGVSFRFVLDESCWYDWGDDRDQDDWNKVGGMTSFWSANNVDSGIVVMRPAENFPWFQLSFYSNYGKEIAWGAYGDDKKTIGFKAGDEILSSVLYDDKTWKFFSNVNGVEINGKHPGRKDYCMFRSIDPWFGGSNNSPGPHGGVASQDMKMKFGFV